MFEIGNGSATRSSNALTVLRNGNIGITTHTPKARLHIRGGTDASLNNSTGYAIFGNESKANLVFDNNEIMARNNGSTSTLHFQNSGGDVHVGGALAHTSDRRLKKDIVEYYLRFGRNTSTKPKKLFLEK